MCGESAAGFLSGLHFFKPGILTNRGSGRFGRGDSQVGYRDSALRAKPQVLHIKIKIGQEIDFIDDHGFGQVKSSGYFSGLSSPSATEKESRPKHLLRSQIPQDKTRLPTFSINRISRPSRLIFSRAESTRLLSRWQPPSVLICTLCLGACGGHAASIVIRLQISFDDSHIEPGRQIRQRALKQRGLCRRQASLSNSGPECPCRSASP